MLADESFQFPSAFAFAGIYPIKKREYIHRKCGVFTVVERKWDKGVAFHAKIWYNWGQLAFAGQVKMNKSSAGLYLCTPGKEALHTLYQQVPAQWHGG